MISRATVWIGLSVLFTTGMLTGAVGMSLYDRYQDDHRWDRGPAGRQERIMTRLTQDLALSVSQRVEVEPIVQRAHLDLVRLRVQHQPEIDRILAQGMEALKPRLSSEQQAKLEQLYTQVQRRRQLNLDYLRQVSDSATTERKD